MNDEKIRLHISELLDSDIGFGINIFSIRGLENGKFAVSLDLEENWEKIFDESEEALDFFLKVRKEKKLGTDFEDSTNLT